MHQVIVETPCHPTESVAKVKMACLKLFPDAEFEEDDEVTGTAASLERLAELFKAQRIRTSAREALLGAVRDNRLVIHLNKQAAFAGKASFSAQSSLGDIAVTIIADDLRSVVDEVAPLSKDR